MKRYAKIAVLLLALSLMSGCAKTETAPETQAPTAAPETTAAAQPAQTLPEETEAPTEPAPTYPEPVMPETDAATGTLNFYINGQTVHAGGKVSDLMDAGVVTYDDLSKPVNPGEMSELIQVRVELENVAERDEPFLFFVAMNPMEEPLPVSECLIYSLTVNCDGGISFGSGKEKTPFVTGNTTRDVIEAAYGAPTEINSQSDIYAETVYYQPFNCVSFTYRNGVVRQVFAYYSANLYGDLAQNAPKEVMSDYYGADAFILMSRYMDVTEYLPGHSLELKAKEEEDLSKQRTKDKLPKAGEVGVTDTRPDVITLGGYDIRLGCRTSELPAIWWQNFDGLMVPIERNFYMRVGRNAMEEFYIINDKGQNDGDYPLNNTGVKGVITENCHYTNWGTDNSGFYEFGYDGLTQDATIPEILEKYGQPSRLFCTSSARFCFAWLHYDAVDGNQIRFKVDPMTNQLVEIRVSKYIDMEMHY